MEGATPAGGGKASAAVFQQACLVEKRRARFWAASPTASPPSFAENSLDGARLERSGNRASEAKPLPRTNADEHTTDRDRPDKRKGQARHKELAIKAHALGGAGWEVPEAAVGETERPTPTPPRPRATAIQPPSWDEHRTRSWARIEEG